MISNSGHDERNKYSGGKAGDQGRANGLSEEWGVIGWYSRPWTHILRHPDANVREMIAKLGEEAAANNLIGYDQSQRTTYWKQLSMSGYRPKNIKALCEADCSAGVSANVKATGYLLNNAKLKKISENTYSGNIVPAFRNAGFQVLTASKYTKSPDYLLRGDILVYEHHHVATNLTNGSKSGASTVVSSGGTISGTNNKDSLPTKIKYYVYVKETGTVGHIWYDDSAAKMSTIPAFTKNAKLGVSAEVTNDKTGEKWYYFTYNSRKGFIKASLCSKTQQSTSTTTVTGPNGNPLISLSNGKQFNKTVKFHAMCIAGSLNVRIWPGTDNARISAKPTLKYGEEFDVCDSIKAADGSLWYYIKIIANTSITNASEHFGFVHSTYVKVK